MANPDMSFPLFHAAESPREALLRKINDETDLPSLGLAIAQVLQITSSGEDSVARLAHFVLSDVALTQKILRLSNTVQYRASAGSAVTTVSRSIFLLGFDTVKASAMAMLLVDCFKNKAQAGHVRKELIHSLCASIIGRQMAQRGKFQNAEEAAVAALFKNIGRVLIASYDHALYGRIVALADSAQVSLPEAAATLLGCSFERFGEMALQEWKIPEAIIQSLAPLPHAELKKPVHRIDWLKQVASFADTLATLILSGKQHEHGQVEAILQRYGKGLELDRSLLSDMLMQVDSETRQMAKSMDLALPPWHGEATQSSGQSGIPSEFLLRTEDVLPSQESERYPSGKPRNARELLLAGVQDVTQMLASEELKLNDLILLVLETLYSAMGFRFATVCLRDLSSNRYVARVAVGEQYAQRQKHFHFPVKHEADLFHLSMTNNVDVMIADAQTAKIRSLLPAWYQESMSDVHSFIILPLVIQKKPLGLFYADRAVCADEGVSPDETALIKTLKSQLQAAMLRG